MSTNPAPGKRHVLVIGVDAPTFDKVSPLLERSSFEVDRFPRGRASLELLSVVAFDSLLVRFPLPDMPIQDFLDELRKPGSLCLKTPVLLLIQNGSREEAEGFVGKGANRVLPIEETSERLQEEVSGLLHVAPRLSVRVMASLQVQLAEGTSLAMCQTENVSSTGMLVRTTVGYPAGTKVAFEFTLPGEPRPVKGEAEVVRHTTIGREKIRGIGCRFVRFEGDGEAKFKAYVEKTDE